MKTTIVNCFQNFKGSKILETKSLTYLSKSILAVILIMLIYQTSPANNLSVSNVSLTGLNTGSQFIMVKCDISWENSWRTSSAPNNWDAAWVFVKFKINGNYISASGATSSGTIITVGSTTGLRVGMPVRVTSGTGTFVSGTVVTAITNGTTFTISTAPSLALSSGAVVTGYAIWEHATLNTSGHSAPSGSTITSAPDGMGIFIYRNADGTGTNTFNNAELRWNYGVNNVTDGAPVDINVYAIEMVYVPQGSFNIGSGGSEKGRFYKYPTTTNTFLIDNEGTITIGTSADNLYYTSENPAGSGDFAGPIPESFPKGYNAFYSMKYEISQKQYVDLLNTLTFTQQAGRTATVPSSTPGTGALISTNQFRNGVDIMTSGVNPTTPAVYGCNLDGDGNYNESNDGQHIACNYLSWADLAGYLHWSGLRPMTELEFEKSCRGTLSPVANERVWGNISMAGQIDGLSYSISNSGSANETIFVNFNNSGTTGNAANIWNMGSINGPVRGGIFAGNSLNSDGSRVKAGATYYGIMEMAGNVWERVVTLGKPEGRGYTGTHGNGKLDANGLANSSFWPVNTTALGSGCRGGFWNAGGNDNFWECTSDRTNAAYADPSRTEYFGGRGVRTAP